MRQLHAESWNYAKSYNIIIEQIQWRQTKLPITLEDIHS